MRGIFFATVVGAITGGSVVDAQAVQQGPLSVIDWLDDPAKTQGAQPRVMAAPDLLTEPPVTTSAMIPEVLVRPLGQDAPRYIGLVPSAVTGLPASLWSGSAPQDLVRLIEKLPDARLPAANALLYTLLLAETDAPQGGKTGLDALTLARVSKLMALGALDPAESLIQQAGPSTSPAHFALWADISLLTGQEDAPCAVLHTSPHLASDYGLRIFCEARRGNWENAALMHGSATALGLLSREKLNVLARFLDPDYFEDAAELPPPRTIDPLCFRLFEAIGEPLATGPLPRAYAVADLRDLAGWKSQLEAAERLTRTGALSDNRLLGIYSDRKPAASGGIWDRVSALRRFETALATRSNGAISKTLPQVWNAMREAQLEVTFAGLFGAELSALSLDAPAAQIALEVGFLSPAYEVVANRAAQTAPPLLVAIARGEAPVVRPEKPLERAVFEAFTAPTPRSDIIDVAQGGALGAAILRTLMLLHDGSGGDAAALRDALSTLRALGLEDTARRAALQILLLERPA